MIDMFFFREYHRAPPISISFRIATLFIGPDILPGNAVRSSLSVALLRLYARVYVTTRHCLMLAVLWRYFHLTRGIREPMKTAYRIDTPHLGERVTFTHSCTSVRHCLNVWRQEAIIVTQCRTTTQHVW